MVRERGWRKREEEDSRAQREGGERERGGGRERGRKRERGEEERDGLGAKEDPNVYVFAMHDSAR